MPGTAIFDMDKTLTKDGTWTRYVVSVNKWRPTFWLGLPALGIHAIISKMGFASRQSVKERSLRSLKWATRSHLESAARTFAEKEVANGLRKRTQSVIETHRAKGDKLVMATAASDLVAEPIAKLLGIEIVVCTKLGWNTGNEPEARLTGHLSSANCYGPEKLELLLLAHDIQPFVRPITAYSDHGSDEPFLSWADHGIAVNPSRKLRTIAAPNGFRIENWNLVEGAPTQLKDSI